jgi:hypothetical protein
MTQRRVIVLTLTGTSAELRHMASCIDVGNEEHEDAFEYNAADALSSKLNRIADALELNSAPDGADFMIPFIQEGVAQGAASRAPDDMTGTSPAYPNAGIDHRHQGI